MHDIIWSNPSRPSQDNICHKEQHKINSDITQQYANLVQSNVNTTTSPIESSNNNTLESLTTAQNNNIANWSIEDSSLKNANQSNMFKFESHHPWQDEGWSVEGGND
jgi:hypothetical protein